VRDRRGWQWLAAASALLCAIMVGSPARAQQPAPPSKDTAGVADRAPAGGAGFAAGAAGAPGSAADAPGAAPAAVVAGEEGFGLRAADGAFALRLRGGFQYDGRFVLGGADDAATDAFQPRRVRADLTGTLWSSYDFRAHVDFAGNRVDLLDAYLDARFSPALRLRAGRFKAPVGLERLQTPLTMPFTENALPTSLVPNRDAGVQLHGALGGGLADYALGVFNGAVDGGSEEGDASDGKDVAARVFLRPFRRGGPAALRGLGVGVAGTLGRQAGTAAAPNLPAFRTSGRDVFFRYRSDGTTAGTAIAAGERVRLAPQAYWSWGPVGVLGEYVVSRQEVQFAGAARTLTHTAWNITGALALTGEAAAYQGIVPRRRFDRSAGGPGAIELVGRANGLAVDPAAFPLLADPARSMRRATALGAGVNWYLNRNVRLMLSWERTRFTAASGGAARPAEQSVVSRFQVAF